MVLINGIEQQSIDALDRGFQYGDGLFETILIENGAPVFLQRHINRLIEGCRRLAIKAPDQQLLCDELIAESASVKNAILKLIVTRGIGGRGYRISDKATTTRVISLHELPQFPFDLFETGVRTRICDTRLGINPALAGIKHLNRLEQILARAEWDDCNIHEGLLLDSSNNIVEGTMSNLFCVKQGRLYTPVVDQCGVEGVMRSVVIDAARQHDIQVECLRMTQQDVEVSDELFLTNSIIEIWPITQLGNQYFSIGSVTKQVKQWIHEHKQHC